MTIRKLLRETVFTPRGKFEGGDGVGMCVFAQILLNSEKQHSEPHKFYVRDTGMCWKGTDNPHMIVW